MSLIEKEKRGISFNWKETRYRIRYGSHAICCTIVFVVCVRLIHSGILQRDNKMRPKLLSRTKRES